ncbi:hypothetical protein RHECNPAF_13600113 [Rhizobium etli CNPAF512]|nr:hypothetical protein RHECNPAF_13600113 [Rhizobium etli CNPAF512]
MCQESGCEDARRLCGGRLVSLIYCFGSNTDAVGMSVRAEDVERHLGSVRMAFAVGDLVVTKNFRVGHACIQIGRQVVGERAIRLDMERAIGAGNVGYGVRSGVYLGAQKLAQEHLAVVAGNVVVQNVAADGMAFGEAVGVIDRDRLDLGHALDVQGEQAEVGVAGAVGDLVGNLFDQRLTMGETDLGSVAQNIGIAAVGLDEERAVIAMDFGDLTGLLGTDCLLVEGAQEQVTVVGGIVGKKIAGNYVGFLKSCTIVSCVNRGSH